MFNLVSPDALGPNCKVLNRVPLTCLQPPTGLGITKIDIDLRPELEGPITKVAIIDLETTGLELAVCEAVELGIVTVGFCHGVIKYVYAAYGALNQPKKPIPLEVSLINGITNEMVQDQKFDINEVKSFLADVDFIVAHNAGFDRPFFDRDLFNTTIPWACSSRGGELNWKSFGYKSAGLENIAADQGFFYDAHRAVVDCLATVWVLHVEPDAAIELFQNAVRPAVKIKAWGSPFSAKDQLRADGYRWNPTDKVWEKNLLDEEAAKNEIERLEKVVYHGAARAAKVVIKPANEKYME